MAGEVQATELTGAPQIPNRLFFRIGDVAELAGLEAYVLRYWETEFPVLKPKKTSNGQRQYRRKDVEVVLEIKRLLYDEGYTIAGARKALKDKTRNKRTRSAAKPRSQGALFADPSNETIDMIKKELQELLALLR
ncbi:MAG: MerR family transcriptional regulator [Acidobacteria bacterium]|nr:MerR family transcriptional regulator [Acidobacteriota bacterium]MDA1235620.1 MerR family transcriptional regulator [Acidobacteriota bacterium]